jgi:hypothetical protein
MLRVGEHRPRFICGISGMFGPADPTCDVEWFLLSIMVAGENLFASRVPITVPREQVPVPEPATVLNWGSGLAGLALAGCRGWRSRAGA